MEFMFGELGLRRVPAEGAIPHKTKWLIEKHWVLNGTGILAGVPKLGKTWLALDMNPEEASFDATGFTKNRERLLVYNISLKFFDAVWAIYDPNMKNDQV